MKNIFKLIIKTLIGFSLAFMPSNLIANEPFPDGSIKLSFMVFETPNLPAKFWDDAIDRTVKKFPRFKINKIVPPNVGKMGDYLKQLQATGQFPDVMMSNFPMAEFIEAGLLLPFEDEDLTRFLDPVGLGLTNNKQYALPQLTVVESVVFYNKDLFKKAGIASEPETWQDLENAAAKIKATGHVPFIVGGAAGDAWAAAWPFMNLVSLNVTGKDRNFLKDFRNGEKDFSDPLMQKAIEAYVNLVEKGWTNKTALSLNYAELQKSFLAGDGAMYPMGSFVAGAVPLDHPFEVGVFIMPTFDSQKRIVTYTSGGPAISAKTKHPEQARLFAVEFATNVETNADDLFRDAHIPNNKMFDLKRDMKNYKLHPLLFEIIDILATPGAQLVNIFTFEVGDYAVIPGVQGEFFAQSQEILAGRKTQKIISNLNNKLMELK